MLTHIPFLLHLPLTRIPTPHTYSKHDPSKLDTISAIIDHYRGRHDVLRKQIEIKYLPREEAAIVMQSGVRMLLSKRVLSKKQDIKRKQDESRAEEDLREHLINIYQKHDPTKVHTIPKIIEHYRGRHAVLLQNVQTKYVYE